jgi:formylglycine-generating enzyme required for sulfatase activity
MMNDIVRDTLKKLVAQYGVDLCANRQRLEGLLRDYCGDHRREIAVLAAAVREGVAEELRKVSGAQVDGLLFHRLVRRLDENAGIAEAYAQWAVESWAAALGKTAPQNISAPPRVVVPQPAPIVSPQPFNVQERTNHKDGAVMIFIPKGEFLMGSNDYDDEKPPHRVTLDDYWIYKFPVTVAQYRRFCQATGRQEPLPPNWGWQDDHPIVNVSWNDATAYATWAGVRLPTEAEWEKAARGTDGRRYPWGNEWDASRCNNWKTGPEQTTPVGSYPQGVSPYGVHDMVGNVWEWCADWYGENYYRTAPSENPKGPGWGQYRVLRGGSWYLNPRLVRVAFRDWLAPDFRNYIVGFRCVAVADSR